MNPEEPLAFFGQLIFNFSRCLKVVNSAGPGDRMQNTLDLDGSPRAIAHYVLKSCTRYGPYRSCMVFLIAGILFFPYSFPVHAAPEVDSTKKVDSAKIMHLAYRFYNGEGTPVDQAKAFRLYLKAAEMGNAEAQFIVGGLYYKGIGTDVNQRQAFKWLLRAEQQGHFTSESLTIIGSMYLEGRGAPQNYLQAKEYLRRAAEQGNLIAKKNLAFLYYNGMGAEPDYGRALTLYTEVALHGDNAAQNNVALMHENGLGTDIDRVQAYAWYNLAAGQGNTGAMVARNKLIIRMNWEELNRAQALSVRLFKQIANNQGLDFDLQ